MTEREYLGFKLRDFREREKLLKEELRAYVINPEFPIDQRYQFFLNSELGKQYGSIPHFKVLESFSNKHNTLHDVLFSGDHYSRGEVSSISEVTDKIHEWLYDEKFWYESEQRIAETEGVDYEIEEYEPDYGQDLSKFVNKQKERFEMKHLEKLKEEILNTMIKSFTFDW